MRRSTELEEQIIKKFAHINPVLDERSRRLWGATESQAMGYGGDAIVSAATGMSRTTLRRGRHELLQKVKPTKKLRQAGGGRPKLEKLQPGLKEALEKLIDPLTRGDPESPLRWTCKSRAKLCAEMVKNGWNISSTKVSHLLHELHYSLQSARKSKEGSSHPDRNAQFENIAATASRFLRLNQPVISVDTKKKELVGNFKNGGREWQPRSTPEEVRVHDFPSEAIGKAIPYGVYDMGRNEACVNVGKDHDTPAFAVASIRQWWNSMGKPIYAKANELFITADSGGSNSARARAWKFELQKFSDETKLVVHVSHFPPGTSK